MANQCDIGGCPPPPCPESNLVGVCYEQPIDQRPPLSGRRFAALCKQYGIGKVRLFEPNSNILHCLRDSNIEVILCVPNNLLPSFVNNPANAASWVSKNVAPYLKCQCGKEDHVVKFKYIAVGDKVSPSNPNPVVADYAKILVQAMENVYAAILEQLPCHVNDIKVTTVLDTAVDPPIGNTFENVKFTKLVSRTVSFLRTHYKEDTKLPILVNVQSYDFYCKTPDTPSVSEIFEYILNMEKSALAEVTGEASLDVIVSATGWPSAGGPEANLQNAEIYTEKMVQLITDGSVQAYLYQMFDNPPVHGVTKFVMVDPHYMPWGIYKFPIYLLLKHE